MQTWTGVFKKGEIVEIALRVFKSSVFGWLNGEGLDGVLENRDEIPVGDPDADDMNELRATFVAEKVARSLRVWNMLIQKITSQPIQQEILACRSPQQVWRVFVNHYSTRKGEETYQLEMIYTKGRMKMCWTTCPGECYSLEVGIIRRYHR